MNQKETYEIIIAQKLEQLPVPAMEDAIWDRISAQLDIEMPQTTPPDNTPPDNSAFLNTATLFVLLTALSCYLLIEFFHQTHKLATPPPVSTPATIIKDTVWHELPPPTLVQPPPEEKKAIDKNAQLQPDTAQSLQSPALTQPEQDSVAAEPQLLINTPPVIVPTPPPVDTAKKPKPKGVRGLTDDDYKIAPKKTGGP